MATAGAFSILTAPGVVEQEAAAAFLIDTEVFSRTPVSTLIQTLMPLAALPGTQEEIHALFEALRKSQFDTALFAREAILRKWLSGSRRFQSASQVRMHARKILAAVPNASAGITPRPADVREREGKLTRHYGAPVSIITNPIDARIFFTHYDRPIFNYVVVKRPDGRTEVRFLPHAKKTGDFLLEGETPIARGQLTSPSYSREHHTTAVWLFVDDGPKNVVLPLLQTLIGPQPPVRLFPPQSNSEPTIVDPLFRKDGDLSMSAVGFDVSPLLSLLEQGSVFYLLMGPPQRPALFRFSKNHTPIDIMQDRDNGIIGAGSLRLEIIEKVVHVIVVGGEDRNFLTRGSSIETNLPELLSTGRVGQKVVVEFLRQAFASSGYSVMTESEWADSK